MNKSLKKFLASILVVVMILTVIPFTGLQLKASASDYGADYTYWSQGAASDEKMRKYGCWVVSQSKMIYETGINKNSDFNPDKYLEWEKKNGYIDSGYNQINGTYAPVAYAKSLGNNGLTFLGTTNTDIHNKIWSNINNGYYSILHVKASGDHYIMIANALSSQNGVLYMYDTWSGAQTYGPRLLSYSTICEVYSYSYEPPTPSYANIGDDFYAYIIKRNSWKHLESSASGNVQIASNGNDCLDPKQVWHFLRQSDNSYKIVNEYKNTCLDADSSGTANGTNVQTYESNDTSAQRWYMIPSGGGCYRIKAKYCDLYLDCLNDTDTPETNVQLWETSLDTAQVFSIYNVTNDGRTYSKPARPPKVTGSATINPGNVTLSWTDSPVRNDYDKREFILTVYDSDNNLILKEEGLTGTSYTFNPPGKGRYHFSVKAINTRYYDWWSAANTVYFDINKPAVTICFDCRNSDFDIGIDESKGFFLSDNKVICTTTKENKEIDGIPNVFYRTIYEGCKIGEDGLLDFDDSGLIVPPGYELDYWECRENPGRKYSDTASFYTVTDFVGDYDGTPTVVHMTPIVEPKEIRVTLYRTPGGGFNKYEYVNYMEAYGSLPDPIGRSGFEFKGWYTSENGGSLVTEDTICTQTTSHRLYSHWNLPKFTITLDNMNASTAGTEKIFYQYYEEKNEGYYFYTDEDCTVPFENSTIVCPQREGYIFKGYFTEKNGGGTQYIDENGVCINNLNKQTENLTLYACWQINTHIHSYEVSVIDATCTEPGKIVYLCACGSSFYDTIPANGHSFSEWEYSIYPTYQTDGVMERECGVCHKKETKAVSKPIYNCCFEDKFIYGVEPDLKISEFVEKYTDEKDVFFSILSPSNKIGTGTKIKLDYPNDYSFEYNVVIFGDVNSDGIYDGTDALIVSCIVNGMLTKEQVGEAVYTAADCNHDGVIDEADVELLNNAGLVLSQIDQSKSHEELLETSSAYNEYLSMINQCPITQEPEQESKTLLDFVWDILLKLFDLIKSFFQ